MESLQIQLLVPSKESFFLTDLYCIHELVSAITYMRPHSKQDTLKMKQLRFKTQDKINSAATPDWWRKAFDTIL